MKHKHAELIKAWADGAQIEYLFTDTDEWCPARTPRWAKNVQYRVKPKMDCTRYFSISEFGAGEIKIQDVIAYENVVALIFNCDNQLKSAEVIK